MDESKAAIRHAMRRQRRALAEAVVDAAGAAATDFVLALPAWRAAPSVIAYVDGDHEVPTGRLIAAALAGGKRVFLPRLTGAELTFAEHRLGLALHPGAFGIPEPAGAVLDPAALAAACAVVPLLAWDRAGGRLGRGGGHYDRAFASARPACLVGLAYAFQQIDAVPCATWDVRLDCVVTERGIVDCRVGDDTSPLSKEGVRNHGISDDDPDDAGRRRGAGGRDRLVAPTAD